MSANNTRNTHLVGWLAGFGLVVLGLLGHFATGEPFHPATLPLYLGVALLLFLFVVNRSQVTALVTGRSFQYSGNAIVFLAAVFAILVLVNYLSSRRHTEWDLTKNKRYSLSDQSRKVVSGLKKDLKVIVFHPPVDQAKTVAEDLLGQYQAYSDKVKVEFVDIRKNPDRAKTEGITAPFSIVVKFGENKETLTVPPALTESDLTNTIVRITRDKKRMAYFLQDHGEKSLARETPRDASQIRKIIESMSFGSKPLFLATEERVPEDCDMLLILGPRQALSESEEVRITKYLDGGGHVLMALDPQSPAAGASFLGAYGIAVPEGIVVESSKAGRIANTPLVFIARPEAGHVVTESIQGQGVLAAMSRPAMPNQKPGPGVQVSALLTTTPTAYSVTDIPRAEKDLRTGKVPDMDFVADKKGPVTIAVAASREIATGTEEVRADGSKGKKPEARLLVTGSSALFQNDNMTASTGNLNFAGSSVAWLMGEGDLISVAPKDKIGQIVTLSQEQGRMVLTGAAAVPFLILICGMGVYFGRRSHEN